MSDLIPDRVQRRAAQAVDPFEQVSNDLKSTGTAICLITALGGEPPPRYALAAALVGLASDWLVVPALEWVANDPAEPWYAFPTRRKRSHMRADTLGDTPRILTARRAFDDLDLGAAATRALMRAVEREQGALEAGEARHAVDRRFEREEHRDVASRAFGRASESLSALADDLAELSAMEDEIPSQLPPKKREELARLLEEARVPEYARDEVLGAPSRNAFRNAPTSLRTGAKVSVEFSVSLEGWDDRDAPTAT